MTTEPKFRTITLTNRAPVRIREDQWPEIAGGSYDWHDGEVEAQANRRIRIYIKVRRHADGRAIVYALYDYDTHFQHEQCKVYRTGVLLNKDADIVDAISVTATELTRLVGDMDVTKHIRDAKNECIANLPAETLD